MKGHRLIIKVLAYLAIVLSSIMVILNLYPSWSQYARTLEEYLLLATLSSISSLFLIRSFTHPEKDRILFLWPIDVRIEHINRYTGFLFIGVLCTPVTHPEWYINIPHLIFTALAILTAYAQLYFYYPNDKILKTSSRLSIAIGLMGFAGGYFFDYYSIGMGELIIALTLIIFILTTNKE